MLNYFPKYFSNRSIIGYTLTFITISVIFMERAFPFWLWLFGFGSIFLFFAGSNALTKRWMSCSSRDFINRLFGLAFVIRAIYVIFIYNFNLEHYGTFYESTVGDIAFYVPTAEQAAQWMSEGKWDIVQTWDKWGIGYSDMGYMLYLAFVYYITSNISIVVLPLLLKSVWGALTCVYMYKLARNNFSEGVARMTGIFCMFQWSLILWTGSMMKETELIFLVSIFLYNTDKYLIKNSNLNFKSIFIVLLSGGALFTFRSALGIVAVLAAIAAVLFSSKRVVSWVKKVSAAFILIIVVAVGIGSSLSRELETTREIATNRTYQQRNMEWRTQREHGNRFAKYASSVVFAPLIFTIPFPTMTYTHQAQEMIMQTNGGNYEKNIMSFFVLYALLLMIKPYNWRRNLLDGEWRNHVFLLAFLGGYLMALVLSTFAQSGRFHMPIIPLEMMFAAYGVSLLDTPRKMSWFNYVLFAEFIICVGWNWFKLSGQGLI